MERNDNRNSGAVAKTKKLLANNSHGHQIVDRNRQLLQSNARRTNVMTPNHLIQV